MCKKKGNSKKDEVQKAPLNSFWATHLNTHNKNDEKQKVNGKKKPS